MGNLRSRNQRHILGFSEELPVAHENTIRYIPISSFRQTDVHYFYLARNLSSFTKEQAGFVISHGYGKVGPEYRVHDLTGGGIQSRRNVDGHFVALLGIHILQELHKIISETAIESGSEYTVHQNVVFRTQRLQAFRRIFRSVDFQIREHGGNNPNLAPEFLRRAVGISHEIECDGIAQMKEPASNAHSVSAVISRSAHNQNPRIGIRKALRNFVHHTSGCIFHQHGTWNTFVHRVFVHVFHGFCR